MSGLCLFLHRPQDARAPCRALLSLARIRLIAVDGAVVLADEIGKHLGVVHATRRRAGRVHKPALSIGADVHLHAEIPLVALLRLPHLRIAHVLLVLR